MQNVQMKPKLYINTARANICAYQKEQKKRNTATKRYFNFTYYINIIFVFCVQGNFLHLKNYLVAR